MPNVMAFVIDAKTEGPEFGWDGRGNIGGHAAANAMCQSKADENELFGTFIAFLSSSEFDFYGQVWPQMLDVPMTSPGAAGTGNTGGQDTVTLNDLRDPTKHTQDMMWDATMFFRADGSRVPCGFNTLNTWEAWTGMDALGNPSAGCNGWTTSEILPTGSSAGSFFDRGPGTTPAVGGSAWTRCTELALDRRHTHVSSDATEDAVSCTALNDGLLCVQQLSATTAECSLSSECPGWLESCCAGQCVDLSSDPSACGACGVVCESGLACVQGQCGCASDADCEGGDSCCSGQCVDTSSNDEHCGGCDVSCQGFSCEAGECVP